MVAHRSYFKDVKYRSEPYLRAVASLPCVRCGVWGYTQAAHMGGLAHGKGGRTKVSDARTAALCGPRTGIPGCHAEVGDGLDGGYEWIALTVIALIEAGQLKVAR